MTTDFDSPSLERIAELRHLWERERQASHERFVELYRGDVPLRVLETAGVAARDLAIDELAAAPGGRFEAFVARRSAPKSLDHLRLGVGSPVILYMTRRDGDDAVRGIVSRRREEQLAIVLDDIPDALHDGGFRLELDDDDATFDRGLRALRRLAEATRPSDAWRLRELLYGDARGEFRDDAPRHAFDPALNEPQLHAVAHAMAALDLALVHGPPGTGKTRTVVEIVRRAVASGETVLATAPSNTAVDNLAARLVDAGLRVVRVGHPARVDPALEQQTLDAWLQASPTWALARKWMEEARAIRRKVDVRSARGNLSREERRELLGEARRLTSDARKQLRGAQQHVLDRAQVVCATAAGADTALLGARTFDLVVLDEATQAPDPIALVALTRGRRWVLAGDPRQLPPTIIDPQVAREGLGRTLFERLAERDDALLRMLVVQYRMASELMAFPSESMYEGRLVAAESVAAHRLTDLEGIADDADRPGALVFIDTAGKGWEERRDEDGSTYNPEQAVRTAEEVRRLLARGLAPKQLAVISPYRAQVLRLRAALAEEHARGLEIDTIDAFQGREKEAIVVDLVRSNAEGDIGFLADTRRMNVALTRAKRFLLVLGDTATIAQHPYYASFLDAVEVYGSWLSAWDT